MMHNYHLFCSRIYYYRYPEYNEHIWIHDHDKYLFPGDFHHFTI